MNLRLPFSAAYVRVIYIHLYPRVSILRIADHDRIVLNGAAGFIDISESRLSRFCGSRTELLIVSCQPSRCCPSRTHSFRRLVLWSARYRLHTWHHLLIVPPHIIMHASKRDLYTCMPVAQCAVITSSFCNSACFLDRAPISLALNVPFGFLA